MSDKLEIPGLPVFDPPRFDEQSVRDNMIRANLIARPDADVPPTTPQPSTSPVTDVVDPLTGEAAQVKLPETSSLVKDVKYEGEIPEQGDPKESKHFKTLKTKLKTVEEQLEARAAEIAAKDAEVARIVAENVEKERQYQEDLKKAREDAETNKKYREIYSLEDSTEYQTKYVKPAADILGTLYQYAEDYGGSQGLIDDILNSSSIATQNRLLATKFDSNAIMQITPLIQKFRAIIAEKREADKTPLLLKDQLRQEAELKKIEEARESEHAITTAKNLAWTEISKVYNEYPYTKDILASDSKITEFAKNLYEDLITVPTINGMKVAPLEWTKKVAAVSQKAAAFDNLVVDTARKDQRIRELEEAFTKLTGSIPGMARAGIPNVETQSAPVQATGTLPARNILQNLLVERSKEFLS